MKKDDVFIQVIQYAVNKNGSFDLLEMFQSLDVSDSQRIMLLDQIAKGNLLAHDKDYTLVNHSVRLGRTVMVWCSANDRFRLLEYQELSEARESSLEANKMATRAIVLSILSFVAAIGFSIYQIVSPISLPERHYVQLEKIAQLLKLEGNECSIQ